MAPSEQSLQSCLYECEVMHARLAPRQHRFAYRIFLFAFDLDELPRVAAHTRLLSVGSRNVYSFREDDYLPLGAPQHNPAPDQPTPPEAAGTLKSRVLALAAQHDVDLTGGRILLVTLPRVLGYLFNPVSFYFCYDRRGAPAAAIAEVTNTFREVKPYFMGPDAFAATDGRFHIRVPKHFYVSPFSDVDVAFDFRLQLPAQRLSVQIDDYTDGARTLTSTVLGARRELTSGTLAWFTLKYPAITLRVITLIHWHAFLLWVKRVPWFAKAARAADQRALFRPHASLRRQPSGPANL